MMHMEKVDNIFLINIGPMEKAGYKLPRGWVWVFKLFYGLTQILFL